MRAVCETCSQAQPPGWRPGELCVHCGQAVRHDLRCFWCAKWTPMAKYCRSCGAECVAEAAYGAARMLKDAGTDRFTVPRMLRELDADQIENFTRIYQHHAVVVARHVDQRRFLERFLRHQGWSVQLEEELVPQLPWNDQAFAQFDSTALAAGDDLATAKAIAAGSPLPQTRALAAIVRLRLDDWESWREVAGALHSGSIELRDEAALALTSWRVRTAVEWREDTRMLLDVLAQSPFTAAAAVRIAVLSREPIELPSEASDPADEETAFAAALVLVDRDRLRCALTSDDDLMRIAAGRRLAQSGDGSALVAALERGPDVVRLELLDALARETKPVPELTPVLLQLVERHGQAKLNDRSPDCRLRELAARVVCRACPPGVGLRLARAAQGDRSIIQSLLQIAVLPADELMDLGAFLITSGGFTMSQYGLNTVAENGRMPDRFVPAHFANADEKTRCELCRFAEIQLGQRGDEELHRFIMQVFYGDQPVKVRHDAWWSLHRWYMLSEPRGDGPFKLERQTIERFFGSVAEFLPRLTMLLRDHATLKEVGVYDHLAHLLGYPEAGVGPDLVVPEAAAYELVKALFGVLTERDYHLFLRCGAAKLLGVIGGHPRWRDEVVGNLRRFVGDANFDLSQCGKRAISAITGEPPPP